MLSSFNVGNNPSGDGRGKDTFPNNSWLEQQPAQFCFCHSSPHSLDGPQDSYDIYDKDNEKNKDDYQDDRTECKKYIGLDRWFHKK